MSTYSDERIEKAIPGTIYMFAGADDTQQACDVSNVKGFQLPDPAGKSGGACTSALLQTLWRDEDDDDIRYSWADTLEMMRTKIEEIGLTQVPQLSASRPIDVNEEIMISNPMGTRGDEYDDDEDDEADDSGRRNRGVKRALLVGVNYTGEANALTSCHNDVRNMKDFLMQVHGFERENMLIMMDDRKHHEPTKQLILDALQRLCEISEPGDSIFFQFSGHGGQMRDTNGDEDDGYDEILIPGDYKESGQITDDEIFETFVTKVPEGVHVVAMVDCCHSGTAMDLPYVCNVGDGEMRPKEGYKAIPNTGSELVPKKKDKSTKKKGKSTKEKKSKSTKKGSDNIAETVDDRKSKKSKTKTPKKKVVEKESPEEEQYEDLDEEGIVETVEDEEEDQDVEYEEEQRPAAEPKKKKTGFFGFGKKKK